MAPLDCTSQGPPFWGMHEGIIRGSFDALHVNVYTNNLNPETAFPVMVFIHGGDWQSGSATTNLYNAEYLIENNVTIVTINYRLGAFGFLSLDDPELNVPGNQAFKDQRMALRWVQVRRTEFCQSYHRLGELNCDKTQLETNFTINFSISSMTHQNDVISISAQHRILWRWPRTSHAVWAWIRWGWNVHPMMLHMNWPKRFKLNSQLIQI